MSTINFAGLSRVGHEFAEWRNRVHMHHELLGLGDRYLEDIGLRRRTGDYRPSNPFRMM